MNTDSSRNVLGLSEEYDRWHRQIFDSGESPDQESPWYRLVNEHLVPLQGKRVLEIACGRGGFATVLDSRGARVFGVDFSAGALRIARQKALHGNGSARRISFFQADAHRLPFADATFDFIVSCETVEHLTDPSLALGEMARVCRPGGLLYLTTPNYLNLMGLYLLYDAFRGRDRRSAATQPLDHHWVFPQVRKIVRRAGWEIQKTDGTVHQVPWPGRNPVRLAFLERNSALRRLLGAAAFHYFVLAKKRFQSVVGS